MPIRHFTVHRLGSLCNVITTQSTLKSTDIGEFLLTSLQEAAFAAGSQRLVLMFHHSYCKWNESLVSAELEIRILECTDKCPYKTIFVRTYLNFVLPLHVNSLVVATFLQHLYIYLYTKRDRGLTGCSSNVNCYPVILWL